MTSEASNAHSSKRFIQKSLVLTLGAGVLVAAAIGGVAYFLVQYQTSQAILKDPKAANEQQTKQVVEEVGNLIVLPENEKPQIATVSDVNKLKNQAFFSKAKNGDIVLIYTQAQKAVLYDPTQKKVVEVGPINLTEASPSAQPTPAELKIALLNGTTVTGLSSTTEKELASKLPTVTVVSKGNASKNTYAKTVIVDVSGKNAAGAASLAQALNGAIAELPEGESAPSNVDILVILGRE